MCNMALFYYDHKYIIFILCRIICYGKIVVAHLCMRHLPPRRIIVVADLSVGHLFILCNVGVVSVVYYSNLYHLCSNFYFRAYSICLYNAWLNFVLQPKKSRCMQRLYRVLNSATYLFLHIHRLKNCQRGSSTYI